ncbi:MAG: septum formation initiator family protein [Candidatus Omnitrophica bacterium]|nr:septum formation initiator family protein [Candidatus Omnitrophota bacterium]
MPKIKIIFVLFILALLAAIFVPGFLKFQKLSGINQDLTERIKELKIENTQLNREVKKLKNDPFYIEKIAREKMKMSKKGELIYKVSGAEKTDE